MSFERYINCLVDTVKNVYPNYFKKNILKQLSKDGLIINDKRVSPKGQISFIMNVSYIDDIDSKIEYILKNDDKKICYKYIEEFEFNKAYRHSVIFEVKEFKFDIIQDLVDENKILMYKKDSTMYDFISTEGDRPTLRVEGNKVYLKFNFLLKNRELEDINQYVKYNVLAIIDNEINVLEIRFDRIGLNYKTRHTFYADIIDKVVSKINDLLNITTTTIDFKAVVNYIKEEKDDVSIYAVELLRNGTIAYLDASSNEEMIIPILGELEQLIDTNQNIFNSNNETKKIKDMLKQFIEGIETNSDLPSVKMIWPEKGIKIGIKHNYKDREYSFFMHYDELGDKERIDYVTRYLIECYRELKNKIQSN
ncbi:hypothetical protein SAMN02745135_02617 [Caloranaerobacter azorensis DSM 13643]|uniref:Uncharacterized protein n=1 Tax=Caloranaerobacter azorensis DSM 13643 TaxID=1121264 RepID=A0A1M5WSF6_9FIRM|nr:hypothetical protein [Caloranaerobacter azorensis]SHH90555.1 hypothetical protein SAMN02745135_02617 [Caloranaerobacter azorensis DSM 13643]